MRSTPVSALAPPLARAGAYSLAVHAAVRFLEGKDAGLLKTLERDMHEAAATEAFERTALLRDKWQTLHLVERPSRTAASGVSAFMRLSGGGTRRYALSLAPHP